MSEPGADAPVWQPERLDHTVPEIAAEIHRLMQAAYRVEAALLKSSDFAPLRRTVSHVRSSTTEFFGIRRLGTLVAATEIEADPDGSECIAALVVSPVCFRRGFGTRLVQWMIERSAGRPLSVSTGLANDPALRLYARCGFLEFRRWRTDCGIAMITLRREPAE